MKKQLLFLFGLFFLFLGTLEAQNLDSLNNRISDLRVQIGQLDAELKATQGQIPPSYGWRKVYTATAGFSSLSNSNWRLNPNPNSNATNITLSMSGELNKIEEKYFWRNLGILSLGMQRLQLDRDQPEGSEFQPTLDVLQISSLYGRNINKKLAFSGAAQLRATVLQNFFNPGYIDLGVGLTWTPLPNLVAVFHPLNYNIIIADEELNFESSLGTQFRVDYTEEIIKGVRFRTNLNGFASYSNLQELSNVTWLAGLSFNAFKGVGVGLEYSLRWAPQETQLLDNDIQQYFLIGLTFAL